MFLMITPIPGSTTAVPADPPPPPEAPLPPTPWSWRLAIAAGIGTITLLVSLLSETSAPQVRSALGIGAFIAVAFLFSSNIRAVNPRVVLAGLMLQLVLATLVIHVEPVRAMFDGLGKLVALFVGFSKAGAGLLFGPLASHEAMG